MASSKEYLDFILEQLSELDDVTCRAMMGEYILQTFGIINDRYKDCPCRQKIINEYPLRDKTAGS